MGSSGKQQPAAEGGNWCGRALVGGGSGVGGKEGERERGGG